jgi:hypothetical protein
MKERIRHTLYLSPAVLLLLVWIVVGPALLLVMNQWQILGAAAATAAVASWSITLFAHAVMRDK